MIIHTKNFKALIDAWDYCNKLKETNALVSKPVIIEKKRKGNIISVTVIAKLKNKE